MIEVDGRVAGGGGIAPLQGGADDICELQKMYFLPVLRGKGLAKRTALQALDFARQHGFRCCYLETTASLTQAVALYEHRASSTSTTRWALPATSIAKSPC